MARRESVKGRENHADTPKLRTRVVKDEQGNLVKITEVEKKVTRTEEFTEEDEEAARKMSASSEQLKEGEYVVMNLDEITEGQNVQEEDLCSRNGGRAKFRGRRGRRIQSC